ncbi:MAG: glycosyltransferase family 39 protein [Thermoanaerobaculaceae bacterium]|jgi:hypothetical protein
MAAASIPVSARERTAALILLGAGTLARLPYIFHYRINSDEPQHLHVVWGWTRGLLQYRDVSDNHSPLFHLLMAPLLALIGERPNAVVLMRFAMVPLALLALWLAYAIAARLLGRRVAMWSAVLLAFHYDFFFRSIEFRTDNLWTVGWLAALAVLVGGPLGAGRVLLTGAAVGATLCVSQKTALMVAALFGGTALVGALSADVRRAIPWRRAVRLAAAAAVGFAITPLVVVGFFASKGALGALTQGALAQNVLADLGARHEAWRRLLLPLGVVLTAWFALPRLRAAGGDRIRVQRVLVSLVAALYVLVLESLWPLVTGQDYLPVFPLAAIMVVAELDRWERTCTKRAGNGRRPSRAPAYTFLAILVAQSGVIVFRGPVWRDRTVQETKLVSDVLRLTNRSEPVMDTKGETVFRTRPFFAVLETITMEKLRRGLMRDTIADDIVRTGCFVAVQDSARFPQSGRAFLNENFVSVGSLRVAGRLLRPSAGGAVPLRFDIAIPGPYAVVTPGDAAAGTLDGTPYSGSRPLQAGSHEFVPSTRSAPLAVVWARAIERGYSPFAMDRNRS